MADAWMEGAVLAMEQPIQERRGETLEVPEPLLRSALAGDATAFAELISRV